MNVFVLVGSVASEFDAVLGVYASHDDAKQALDGGEFNTYNYFYVEEHEVGGKLISAVEIKP